MSWPLVDFEDVVFFQEGPGVRKWQFRTEGVKLVNIKNIVNENLCIKNSDKYLDENEVNDKYRHFLCDEGDLVMASSGATWGKTAWVSIDDLPLCMNTSMIRFKALDPTRLCKFYLRRYLQTDLFKSQMNRLITGSAQPNFGPSHLKQIKIPLPPLAEQKRIAAILDKADAIRRKRQQAIKLADDFLRSVFLDMFGDPVTNPKEWEVKPVGQVVGCIVPGRDKPKSFTGDMPWITTNDLKHLGRTLLSVKAIGLTKCEIKNVKAKIIPKGSVLMTCVGDLGVISLAGNDMVINQQLHALLINDKVEEAFLMYAISFQKHYMLKMASSTTLPYMNKTICNSVPLILPPIKLQKEFSEIYNKLVLSKSKLLTSERTNVNLFNSLSQKAFAGKL